MVIAVPVDHDDMSGIVAGSAERIPRGRHVPAIRSGERARRRGAGVPAVRSRTRARGEDDIVGTLALDRVDGRALPETHPYVELRELRDPPFDDAVEFLAPRIAHDEPQLTAEGRVALEERDLVPREAATTAASMPGGPPPTTTRDVNASRVLSSRSPH